ncbi:Asp23/Gls24 family envelope stress response protein [Streptomyces sp. J2-1]|uniref:DUF6286 domain-containing protein n=1 Tax=Streptomyces corallincola TaxID=2851888 RepID=UPI001C38873A|nr:DUF6286 domain-containing protein [Streptomyces corallincola]MBV2352913.1 Asp23/Gls24 family envelope stress response protein [Streptomyces corallincola]
MTAPAQRGRTTVGAKAVRKIAERAADEALTATPTPTPTSITADSDSDTGTGTGGGQTGGGPFVRGSAGGSATVNGRRANVALRVTLPYPAPLSDTARRVQAHTAERTSALTGLDVATPRLTVSRLAPTAERASGTAELEGGGLADEAVPSPVHHPARRWWSARRVPVAVLVLLAATACTAVTVDVVRVHVAHLQVADWRTGGLARLYEQGPGDPAVVIGGAVLAVLGLWLVVLALTPGRRGQLTVAASDWNAALDRSTLAALVRDTVGGVEGVETVRVRAGRRGVAVRAGLAFGDRDRAREQVTTAARRTLDECRLRRVPRLRVRVVTEPTWRPPTPAPAVPEVPDTPQPNSVPTPQAGGVR